MCSLLPNKKGSFLGPLLIISHDQLWILLISSFISLQGVLVFFLNILFACNWMWCTWWYRYGEIFKTHILGCPSVMLASPEAARFVLVTQAHLFKPTYPKSKEHLIGPSALFFHQGDYHVRLRKLVQGSLSLDAIRNLVADISATAASTLDSWDGGHVLNTFQEMKKVSWCGSICSQHLTQINFLMPLFYFWYVVTPSLDSIWLSFKC